MSNAASANLESSTRDLLTAWAHSREQWRDGKSQQFGQTFIEPLPEIVAQAREAMNQLDAILKKIKHDCE